MRQAALAFRNQIRRLGKVKRTGRDEQHVVGLDRAVLGADGAALDQRQQIALHAFARDIRAAGVLAALADLVDLVDEDDAVFFGVAERLGADRLFLDALGGPIGRASCRERGWQSVIISVVAG